MTFLGIPLSPGDDIASGSSFQYAYLTGKFIHGLVMSQGLQRGRLRHGLSFIAVLAFVASFFGSRIFATLFPNVVVVGQGIHFHHFWYGIAMVSLAGWIGIAWQNNRLDRILALMYGLGAGFIGDEVGLLLTLGSYESELTYQFFIGAMSFVIIALLLAEYGEELEREVLHLSKRERLVLLGLFIALFSSIFFASGRTFYGVLVAALGVGLFLVGFEARWIVSRFRKRQAKN